jgi:hypothetical protein
MLKTRLRKATVVAALATAGVGAVLAGTATSAPGVLAECSVWDPLFQEDVWFPEGMTLDSDVGSITCHNGHWDGPNVDSPLPGGGGGDLPA